MPLVRISHTTNKSDAFAPALSRGVHLALVEIFNVPDDDLFQVVTEHVAGAGLFGPGRFLGIEHSRDLVFVQITCAEGRTVDQKKALYVRIVEKLSDVPGVRKEDIIINLVETKRENWSFGNGLAPFAAN
jgi:4-oxalocrotonate tautomerase